MLEATKLAVGYADVPVCAPVDVRVRPGEILAIVGPNGSGKSTLLRTFLGLLAPITGTVRAFGRTVDERERDFRARVVGVLDDDAFFPGLTVREHLVLTARGHSVADAGPLTDDVMGRFGLTELARAVPSALSSGQRRRFLLASAFVRPREIVLLDEPEQRLDTRMRAELGRMLVAEAGEGSAVVVATHDPGLVASTGARGLVVSDESCRVVDNAGALAVLAEER
ncbi:ABC transporter ATP-binding protein [Paraoerskovia sediminicola]|uniref:ABC transporter ATP-binding protein n=1 Tax=Paraoerskovia sediminicola TaxID=1138587 RepID=A0ABN6XGG3_9CELL|nr:ABC transporter ATP-binding protein [Paraoerskovia sediminicola]BDZ43911.1 ABC transporter ATP-binding protein [Paraoerskovia sediminicola]